MEGGMGCVSEKCQPAVVVLDIPYQHFNYRQLSRCDCCLCQKTREARRKAKGQSVEEWETNRKRWNFRRKLYTELSFIVAYDCLPFSILDGVWQALVIDEDWNDDWPSMTLSQLIEYFSSEAEA